MNAPPVTPPPTPPIAAPSASSVRRLPSRPSPGLGEALDSYLERLAAANHLTCPQLLRQLGPHEDHAWLPLHVPGQLTTAIGTVTAHTPGAVAARTTSGLPAVRTTVLEGGPEASASWRQAAAVGWAPGRGTQLCPACLAETGTWQLIWRHPWVTTCLTHQTWLLAICPCCGLAFRSYRHHQLRSVDTQPGTCGNPTGHRGRPCPQDLVQLATQEHAQPHDSVDLIDPVDEVVLASQRHIHAAVAGETQTMTGSIMSAEDYLAEIKALTVLLLHLAVRPSGHTLATWADAAHFDRDRSPGDRTARWGLAPPADPVLRGRAIAAADHVLTSPDLEEAADRLHPWTELAPTTADGQLGWLADHTRMTTLLTRLVMAATATRRRVSTLLDHDPPSSPLPVTAMPQAVPADLYRRHLARHLDVGEAVGRTYAALCLARRHATAGMWGQAAEILGVPEGHAVEVALRGSGRLTCRPDTFVTALDALAVDLDRGLDYRARERIVRRLATGTRWYRRWARVHHPGSRATSRAHAITWLWTQWAGGLLATSPGWSTPPDRITRSDYRRYTQRLPLSARRAFLDLVGPPPTHQGDPP